MAWSASGTNTTAWGTPVFTECTSTTAPATVTRSPIRRSRGSVNPIVTSSPSSVAWITPANVSNVNVGRSQPVTRCTYRAKHRAPFPHISASDPSEL